jgi:uroporphyrinogen decarboxylase
MLTSKERVIRIIERKDVDRNGFWLGMPHRDSLKMYKKHFNVSSHNELAIKLKSDLLWLSGERSMLNPLLFLPRGLKPRKSLGQNGILYDAEKIEDIGKAFFSKREKFTFPFMEKKLRFAEQNNLAVFSGMGTYFWHKAIDYFGMEECFCKMYTNPEIVTAVIDKIVNIYLKANKSLYDKFSERIDAVFFFNDLGTQLDTLVSPELFREFFMPGAQKLIEQAKSYNLKVALHSCGSIERFIPDIIEMGVDILHPIQANAKNMNAELLQSKYGKDIIFMGGLDTQDILPFGTPEKVRDETRRLINVFGKHFILSPSHEALLSNVSGVNVQAMADEATKIL